MKPTFEAHLARMGRKPDWEVGLLRREMRERPPVRVVPSGGHLSALAEGQGPRIRDSVDPQAALGGRRRAKASLSGSLTTERHAGSP